MHQSPVEKIMMLAFSVATCSVIAQPNVFSPNIVGYATVTINPGYNLMANPLNRGPTNGAGEIMPIIDGEVFLTWNGRGYNYTGYDSQFGGWVDGDNHPAQPPSLPPGKGFFLLNPGPATNVTFIGEVVPAPGTTNTIALPPGYSLLGSPLPANVAQITNSPISLPVFDGMVILTWSGKSYIYTGFDSQFGGWVDANNNPSTPPAYAIAQGFFLLNNGDAWWSQSLP